jgi:hypothetical protein
MVQIYIKYIDDNYYLLDIDEKEVVNLKITAKDLTDITKIFAPFTQSFNIKATDKNKILCGFVGNEKIQRIYNDGKFDALLYVSGFLYQSGKLSFDETDYEFKEQKSFKTNFASNLTGLKDLLGDMTIQELFQDSTGAFDQAVKIDWNKVALQSKMQSITNVTLGNGISLKHGVPFVSNKRVWTYDSNNLSVVDNISFKLSVHTDSVNAIQLDEVRPAISYMTIMEHLLLKIGVPVICPIFSEPQVKDLFVSCNSEKLVDPKASGYNLLTGWSPLTHTYIADVPSISEKWKITQPNNGVFKIKRQSVPNPERWYDGFHISLAFNNLVPLEVSAPSVKVKMINDLTGVTISVQDITNMNFAYFFNDPVTGPSILDANGEIYVRFEILPNTLCAWSDIDVEVFQKYRARNPFGSGYYYNSYYARTKNTTNSALLGGNKMNLITALPKIKCIDFLKSFFKTFNISVISTGLNDQSMYWVTPENINEYNKPYSKRIVDYTQFTNVATLTKKRGNEYNQYIFKHKDSKYYEAVYGNGTNFGELKYPLITPAKATKFEVVTDYSILKQSSTFVHSSSVKTCLAFTKDTPTTLPNGGNRYKPVYDEFTLMYLKPYDLNGSDISLELSSGQNFRLTRVLESSFKNYTNGKTLAFGADGVDTDSLYLNYYKSFIELLLMPNTYKSEFEVELPPNEIFLNFSNLNQGESNIPTGFRSQNEIIIGEQRYYFLDATINTNNGKTKLTLLNF